MLLWSFLCNLIDMSMTEGVICLVSKNIAFYTFLCIPIASRLVTETQLVVTMAYSHFRELMKSVG